jgi:regulator of sirC expression with transglutaminase-like and TPR domain
MQSAISSRFRALASRPESHEGLAEGALVLAAEMRPELDVERSLEAIGALAERMRPGVESARTPTAAVSALNRAFFEVEGFRGNPEQYEDPRNSDLEQVLARRRGLPITLSVLWVEVARRLGLEAYGIGFPGHFLAKAVGIDDVPAGEVIVDPFFACTLRMEDCAERLRTVLGGADAPDPRPFLQPATALEIYARMLNNLKILYLRAGDGLSALGCFDRILVLVPDAAAEMRDRGLLLERLDCIHAAIEDFDRYLEHAPSADDAAAIRRRRDALDLRKPALN